VGEAVRLYGLPSALPEGVGTGALIEAMARDKKSVGGEARFVLPEGIGSARFGVSVERGMFEEVLKT
jgi:3-dehydroquinate synthetase